MMLLALTWPDTIAICGLVSAAGFVLVALVSSIFRPPSAAAIAAVGGKSQMRELAERQDEIADDIAAMRVDLVELKNLVAELDRQFKSVG